MSLRRALLLPLLLLFLSGCEMLGIESAERVAAQRDAEGRAIGGACRHAGRAIEDCYALNRKADKAAVFAGWRDMNDYMRENKIEEVPPEIAHGAAAADAGTKAIKPPVATEVGKTESPVIDLPRKNSSDKKPTK